MAARASFKNHPSLVGSELGGFQILSELATGGMGTVYLGHRTGLAGFGQPAAIKIIHPHMAQERAFVEMFVDEARIASCIHHPNVCKVLDFGKAQGTFYLAMEYLLGETWASTSRGLAGHAACGRLAPKLLAHVIAQACEGLHAAHEAVDQRGVQLQIVHRDISPQNLFVGYDGSVRVLDFGIASAADRLHTTRYGTVKGRYAYMSPEQMLGDHVDRRSDIWSLGVVLREGLTGKGVFRRATEAETVYAVTHRVLPAWEVEVHPELKRITDKAMHWERDQRYASARELGQDLARFASSPGRAMGMAEVSQCMHTLFGPRIEEKRALLQSAAHDNGEPASFSMPPSRLVLPPEESTTVDLRLSDAGWEPELTPTLVQEVAASPAIDSLEPPTTRWQPRRRRTGFSVRDKAAALLALTACAALSFVLSGPAETAPGAAMKVVLVPPAALPASVEPPPPEELVAPSAPMPELRDEPVVEFTPRPAPVKAQKARTPVRRVPERRAVAVKAVPARPVARVQPAAKLAAPSPPAAPGRLNIITLNGWADVFEGARKLGTTPGQFELASGAHTLTLRAHGDGAAQREVVQIEPGQVSRARITLR